MKDREYYVTWQSRGRLVQMVIEGEFSVWRMSRSGTWDRCARGGIASTVITILTSAKRLPDRRDGKRNRKRNREVKKSIGGGSNAERFVVGNERGGNKEGNRVTVKKSICLIQLTVTLQRYYVKTEQINIIDGGDDVPEAGDGVARDLKRKVFTNEIQFDQHATFNNTGVLTKGQFFGNAQCSFELT